MLQTTLVPWIVVTCNIPPLFTVQAVAGLMVTAIALFSFLSWVLDIQATSTRIVDSSPPQLLLPVGNILQSYFENQFDFLRDGFKATSSSVFQFRPNRHNIIVLFGDEGRHIFFREKGLNLYEGFQVLIGTVCSSAVPTNHLLILLRFLLDLIPISSMAFTND